MEQNSNNTLHSNSGASNDYSEDALETLSADLPKINPKDDLFGHAPFASILAQGISSYTGSDGMVLALYGSWGSGKSTVLNFIEQYLNPPLKKDQPDGSGNPFVIKYKLWWFTGLGAKRNSNGSEKPFVVKYRLWWFTGLGATQKSKQPNSYDHPVVFRFNPWWFSGQENLVLAFFGQLQSVLNRKSGTTHEKLGNSLIKLAQGLSGLTILPAGFRGYLKLIINLLLTLCNREPKDVIAIKNEISTVLSTAGKRIIVFIDDIDRLTPEEIRQLFTVIKAVADFPNVVYFLAFDREVAVRAIKQGFGIPGNRYLEKIIQASFEMPPVDREAMHKTLFERLDSVLGDTPEKLFDKSYWVNVFYEGIEPLIHVPRDVVRLANTLTVTYPAVRGEVNIVDFIALETIRIFLPKLYYVVRSNPVHLTGCTQDDPYQGNQNFSKDFRERLLKEVPSELKDSTLAMLERIFPKISQVHYSSNWLQKWRQDLRACHPDYFSIYFRLTVPPGSVSDSEVRALLDISSISWKFRDTLLKACEVRRSDGLLMAQVMLERLMGYVEEDIEHEQISTIIKVLLDIGDKLIDPAGKRSILDPGDVARAGRPVYHLLNRMAADQRFDMLAKAIQSGGAVATQLWLLRALGREIENSKDSSGATLLTVEEFKRLKLVWVDRLRRLSEKPSLLKHSELTRILYAWRQWTTDSEVRTWCDQVTESDEGLVTFLNGFLQRRQSHTVGESNVSYHHRLNPEWLTGYLDKAGCADRLREMQQSDAIPPEYHKTVSQYLKEYDMLLKGINPDDFGEFDE